MKQVKIHIRPDGTVEAETYGIKGKACTNYIKLLEELLDAEAVQSAYKPEYFEPEQSSLDIHSDNGSQLPTSNEIRLDGEHR